MNIEALHRKIQSNTRQGSIMPSIFCHFTGGGMGTIRRYRTGKEEQLTCNTYQSQR